MISRLARLSASHLAAGPRRSLASASRGAVVLVTGGGTGIGKAVALRLARGGWQAEGEAVAVCLTGRRREVLEETEAEIRAEHGDAVSCLVHPADLTSPPDVTALFAAIKSSYGRLDVLFNNAGAGTPPTTIDKMEYDEWRRVVGINLDAAFHVARDAYRLMAEQSPQVCAGPMRARYITLASS